MSQVNLKKAIETITGKVAETKKYFDYYDGDQPEIYTNKRLFEIFRSLDFNFSLNICAVVIDATKERIVFQGYDHKEKAIRDKLSELVTDQKLLLEADEVHEAALVTGESYVIVWPELVDGIPTNKVEVFYNSPDIVQAFYEPSNPKKMSFAAKIWQEVDKTIHATLYYADHLEYYRTKPMDETADKANVNLYEVDTTKRGVIVDGKKVLWPVNPYGKIPVFHFRLERRKNKSDIKSVLPPQDSINKLVSDMMVAAEYGAFKQRYIISNSDTSSLKNKPGAVWDIKAGAAGDQPSSAGEFSETDLKIYTDAMNNLALFVAKITNTPNHYFSQQADAPSGEALIAMESPLNKKSQDRIDKFAPVWQEIAAFALQIMGTPVDENTISVNFKKPETVQPFTQSQIVLNEINSGIPLIISLKNNGWTQSQIDELVTVIAEQKITDQANIGKTYTDALKRFNAGA